MPETVEVSRAWSPEWGSWAQPWLGLQFQRAWPVLFSSPTLSGDQHTWLNPTLESFSADGWGLLDGEEGRWWGGSVTLGRRWPATLASVRLLLKSKVWT